MKTEKKYRQGKLGVRPETYEKYRKVAATHRWTLTETADAVIDRFIDSTAPGAQADTANRPVSKDSAA